MAYTSTTLNLVSQPIGGVAGQSTWIYTTTDGMATITGAGYISDALKKGIEKGDIVFVVNTSTPSTFRMQCGTVSSGTATFVDTGEIVGAAAASTIGFFGTTPTSQRTSANQAAISTSAAVAISSGFGFGTSAQANAVILAVSEIQATLTALGLWKGS